MISAPSPTTPPPIWRRLAKRGLQHVAAVAGPQRWARDGRLWVLMYHRVLPADHPDMPFTQPGMVVTPETLRAHLAWLSGRFTLVHLDDWLADERAGKPLPPRACAITFDDGWHDNYRYAFPVLKAASAPATIFVVSARAGTAKAFWPERLGRWLLRHASATPETGARRWLHDLAPDVFAAGAQRTRAGIDRVIAAAKRFSDTEIEARLDELEAASPATAGEPDLAGWEHLREMVDSGLVRLGSHTREHVRLSEAVSPARLEDEIAGSAREIAERTGRAPALFCYPNGDTCVAAERLVSAHYAGACTTRRGWNARGADPYRLRRIGIHQDVAADETAFLARLSGWV